MTDHEPGPMPFIPLWVKDFISDTKVIVMTAEDVGAYMLLLFSQWLDGPIDPEHVNRIARCEVSKTVLGCFRKTKDGLVNGKLERVRIEHQDRSRKKRELAQHAAHARWNSDGVGECSSNADAMQTHSRRNADAMQTQCRRNADAMQTQCHQNQNQNQNQKQNPSKKEPIQPIEGKNAKPAKPGKALKKSGMDTAELFWGLGDFKEVFSFGSFDSAEDLFWCAWNSAGSTGISEHGFCIVIAKLMELQEAHQKGKQIGNPAGACIKAIRSGQVPSEQKFRKAIDSLKKARSS